MLNGKYEYSPLDNESGTTYCNYFSTAIKESMGDIDKRDNYSGY